MINITINFNTSKACIHWISRKIPEIHISNLSLFKKRLINKSKYPLKWILKVSTDLENTHINWEERRCLIKELKKLPVIE